MQPKVMLMVAVNLAKRWVAFSQRNQKGIYHVPPWGNGGV